MPLIVPPRRYPLNSHHPSYKRWACLMDRCYNENHKQYPDYGGRGITVCRRWHNVVNFLRDMGVPPDHSAHIDRKNNMKGYSPENCHWVTSRENQNNRRDTVYVTLNGVKTPISYAAEAIGVKHGTLLARVRKGLTPEQVVTPDTTSLKTGPRNDLTGRVFGRLTVECFVEVKAEKSYWRCRCDCGGTTTTTGARLQSGHSKSCGCLRRELCTAARTTHGLTKSPTYVSWSVMKRKHPDKICPEWLTFENFFKDMGTKPEGGSLMRTNKGLPYQKSNCIWWLPGQAITSNG